MNYSLILRVIGASLLVGNVWAQSDLSQPPSVIDDRSSPAACEGEQQDGGLLGAGEFSNTHELPFSCGRCRCGLSGAERTGGSCGPARAQARPWACMRVTKRLKRYWASWGPGAASG